MPLAGTRHLCPQAGHQQPQALPSFGGIGQGKPAGALLFHMVGGWAYPSEKYKCVNWDDYSQDMEK